MAISSGRLLGKTLSADDQKESYHFNIPTRVAARALAIAAGSFLIHPDGSRITHFIQVPAQVPAPQTLNQGTCNTLHTGTGAGASCGGSAAALISAAQHTTSVTARAVSYFEHIFRCPLPLGCHQQVFVPGSDSEVRGEGAIVPSAACCVVRVCVCVCVLLYTVFARSTRT